MEAWTALTAPGQVPRLHPLALAALVHAPLAGARVAVRAGETHTLFRMAPAGGRSVLRIPALPHRSVLKIHVERAGLTAQKGRAG